VDLVVAGSSPVTHPNISRRKKRIYGYSCFRGLHAISMRVTRHVTLPGHWRKFLCHNNPRQRCLSILWKTTCGEIGPTLPYADALSVASGKRDRADLTIVRCAPRRAERRDKTGIALCLPVHGPRVTEIEQGRISGRAPHPLSNRSLATPNHSSEGEDIREEAASLAPPQVPADTSVDQPAARHDQAHWPWSPVLPRSRAWPVRPARSGGAPDSV
jgi:hypothetical protein